MNHPAVALLWLSSDSGHYKVFLYHLIVLRTCLRCTCSVRSSFREDLGLKNGRGMHGAKGISGMYRYI